MLARAALQGGGTTHESSGNDRPAELHCGRASKRKFRRYGRDPSCGRRTGARAKTSSSSTAFRCSPPVSFVPFEEAMRQAGACHIAAGNEELGTCRSQRALDVSSAALGSRHGGLEPSARSPSLARRARAPGRARPPHRVRRRSTWFARWRGAAARGSSAACIESRLGCFSVVENLTGPRRAHSSSVSACTAGPHAPVSRPGCTPRSWSPRRSHRRRRAEAGVLTYHEPRTRREAARCATRPGEISLRTRDEPCDLRQRGRRSAEVLGRYDEAHRD
jgi:hypothetical protein